MLGIAPGARLNANADLDRDLDRIKGLGAHAIRWYANWPGIEPEMGSGEFNWREPDLVIAGCADRELDVCLGISSRADGHLFDPDHVAAIGPFAAAVAARYQPSGVVIGYEGPNEAFAPDVDTDPSGTRYTACQKSIYAAIKNAVGPAALVGTGGIIGSAQHLIDLYAAGCKPFFDFLAWHPYTRPASPTESVRSGHGGWAAMLDARHVMARAGDGHKQIWVTEYGSNTGGHEALSEQVQATDLRDAVSRFRRHPWAGPFFCFCAQDAEAPKTKGDFMGLLHDDGTEKIAAATFRALTRTA